MKFRKAAALLLAGTMVMGMAGTVSAEESGQELTIWA